MHRTRSVAFWSVVFLLAGCGEPTGTSLTEIPNDGEGSSLPTASEIFDGSSGAAGANPHFFFFSPIAKSNPSYSGTADDFLSPAVTVCPIGAWEGIGESCGAPLVTFTRDAADPEDQVSVDPGVKYNVVWKTNRYAAAEGQVYRIAVSVFGNLLGYADVKAYSPQDYSSFQHTDAEGNVAISTNGSLNITFRIEDGALESEYCDPSSLEDCDVAIIEDQAGGCLRVFDNPSDPNGQALGSQACVPANAATLEGQPIGTYAAILTLEKDGAYQGNGPNNGWQIPYFPDLKTDPPGISFDPGSAGAQVVICQATDAVPEGLHGFLRPFAIFADGTVVLPQDYYYGASECEDFVPAHAHASGAGHGGEDGLLSRLTRGFSRVSQLFVPKPLIARRLHGGLNTTVYNTRGDESGGGDGGGDGPANAPVFALDVEEFVVELGAILDIDVALSKQYSDIPAGLVDSPTTFTINVLNAAGEPFPFEVPVVVEVTGANTESLTATYVGAGVYQATYTPTVAGTDIIVITINGEEMPGPITSQVAPLSGDLIVEVIISGGAPSDGLPVILYQGTDPTPLSTGTTDASGKATFTNVVFGAYTVHLPKRDFDVQFTTVTRSVNHNQAPNTVTFTGTTQTLRAGATVWRVKAGGSGNAFQYVVGGRSWVSANNQVQNEVLLGVTGHLATILSAGENAFVAGLVKQLCPSTTNPKQCKYQGWIGLSDDAVEGSFQWVTGEPLTFTSWVIGEPSGKNNEDHVEINLLGFWTDENGASATNEGYVVEWKVSWPQTPPF